MPEIARIVKVGKSMYFSIAPRIAKRLAINYGDRMIVETDGKQLYCVPIRVEELLRVMPRAARRKRAAGE
jgi:hypothetical protein